MSQKRAEAGDERNASFDVPNSGLQDLKPGIDFGAEKGEQAAEGQHRFPRRDKKDIPKESLAVRIGKVRKGR